METLEVNGTRYRVREKELTSKQTEDNPAVAQMRREFAEHPSSGLSPAKLAGILRDAEQGNLMGQCYLAEDIEEKDAHVHAELFKRKMAMTNVPFNIEPPRNASDQERKDAVEIEQMLKDTDCFSSVIFDMSDAILKGFSNVEFEWQRYGNWRVPAMFEHRPASWFQLDQFDQNKILLRNNNSLGEELRPMNWLQHRHAAKSGYPARAGLVRQLAWPFIFKNYSVRDLAEFLEIYGIPIRIGKYPSGATNGEKMKLLQAVINIGHNAGGVIPKGMEIDFHDAAKGGGSDPFMTMISWCERSQSKALVGQTLTAEQGNSGSQALGNVHNEVRQEIRDHDVKQIENTLNRDLVMPMYMLNGKSYTGDPRRKPRIIFDIEEPEDLKVYSDSIPKLVNVGFKIPARYLHEKLRIPEPEGDEPILGTIAKVEPVPHNKTASANLKLAAAALKSQVPAQDAADQFASQGKAKNHQVIASMLKPIEQMIAEASSLEQLLDDLLSLENELDTNEFEALIGEVMVAAELAGRFDVNEGN